MRAMITMRRAALTAMAAVALAAGGCGDDEDDGGTDAAAPAAATDTAVSPAPPADTGAGTPEIPDEPPADAPADVAKCLQGKGYTAEVGGSVPPEVAEATGLVEQVQIMGPDGGAGSISFYGSSEEALEAATAETPVSGSVSARKSNTYWVFVGGEDAGAVTRAISPCI